MDFKTAGQILDDDVFKELVLKMPRGVHVTVLVRFGYKSMLLLIEGLPIKLTLLALPMLLYNRWIVATVELY